MKKTGKLRKHLVFLLAALILCSCGKASEKAEYRLPEEEKLVVYTSHKKEIYEPIIKEFEERSGIWVEVVNGGTNELLERIASENGTGSGDIMFGGGVDSLEAYSEYFSPYRSGQYERLDDTYASENDTYTVFSKLPTVFIYNNKLVIQAGTPRSWKELLNSRWRGKIAFADPAKSGSSYTALLTMIQVLAPQYEQEEVIRLFSRNLQGDILEDSAAVVDDVVAGRKLVGITLEETALKAINKGADIKLSYPSEGTSAVPDGCAIIKNAPHSENARLFLEFIVSEDVQQLLEDKLYRGSVRKDIGLAGTEKEIFYDLQYSGEHRAEILEQWEDLNLPKE